MPKVVESDFRQLCLFKNLRQEPRNVIRMQGVAFPGIVRLAEKTQFSERTVHRAISALERQQWIRIEKRAAHVKTTRGVERKGNLYRFNLAKLGLAIEQGKSRGDRVFATAGAALGRRQAGVCRRERGRE